MIPLAIAAGFICAGAAVTLIASRLIERAHPPRGRRIDIGGFCQHVVELGPADGRAAREPPLVLLHGAGCNLEDMRLALGERLAAPTAKLIVLPGVGHMPHYAAADRVVAAIEELLAKA